MSLHEFTYTYKVPEWGTLTLDIDPDLDYNEKIDIAISEIKDLHNENDIEYIEVSEIKEV